MLPAVNAPRLVVPEDILFLAATVGGPQTIPRQKSGFRAVVSPYRFAAYAATRPAIGPSFPDSMSRRSIAGNLAIRRLHSRRAHSGASVAVRLPTGRPFAGYEAGPQLFS